MKLNQKETQLITELKTQEELCMQKYDFYSAQAKDPELKKLFKKILKHESLRYAQRFDEGKYARYKD